MPIMVPGIAGILYTYAVSHPRYLVEMGGILAKDHSLTANSALGSESGPPERMLDPRARAARPTICS
jgi:hypothetical protein